MANRVPEVVDSATCPFSKDGHHAETLHVRIIGAMPMDAHYCKACGALGPMPGNAGYTTLAVWTAPSGAVRAEQFNAAELDAHERS